VGEGSYGAQCCQPTNVVIPASQKAGAAQSAPETPFSTSRTVVNQRWGRVMTVMIALCLCPALYRRLRVWKRSAMACGIAGSEGHAAHVRLTVVGAQEHTVAKARLPRRVALKSFKRAATVLNRAHKHAHGGEAAHQRWTRLKPSRAAAACAASSTPAGAWKPRFGRTWWEDGLRVGACGVKGSTGRRQSALSDTESEDGSDAADPDSRQQDAQPSQRANLHPALPTKPADFVGQRVQRCSCDAQGRPVAAANATVVGFRSARESGFVDGKIRVPATLWRIKFHDETLGEEELERAELVEAYLAYRGACSAAAMQRDAAEGHWQVSGHALIGRAVRRGIVDQHSRYAGAGKLAGFVDGTIRAWLPPDVSNYFGKDASKPQPLFRVVYHRKEIGIEDLDLEEAQQALDAYSAPKEPDRGQEWLNYGNSYIGKRIRRSVLDGHGSMTAVDGMVSGWLPAELSNFWSEHSRRPAALWRVVYDKADIGQEDLEDFEVEEAVQVYQMEVVRAEVIRAGAAAAAAAAAAGGGGGGIETSGRLWPGGGRRWRR